jgi:hypothetical protein
LASSSASTPLRLRPRRRLLCWFRRRLLRRLRRWIRNLLRRTRDWCCQDAVGAAAGAGGGARVTGFVVGFVFGFVVAPAAQQIRLLGV